MLFSIINQIGTAFVLKTLLDLSSGNVVLVLEFGKNRCRHDKVFHGSECIYKSEISVGDLPNPYVLRREIPTAGV